MTADRYEHETEKVGINPEQLTKTLTAHTDNGWRIVSIMLSPREVDHGLTTTGTEACFYVVYERTVDAAPQRTGFR